MARNHEEKDEKRLKVCIIYYYQPSCCFYILSNTCITVILHFIFGENTYEGNSYFVYNVRIFSLRFNRFFHCIQHILLFIDDRVM